MKEEDEKGPREPTPPAPNVIEVDFRSDEPDEELLTLEIGYFPAKEEAPLEVVKPDEVKEGEVKAEPSKSSSFDMKTATDEEIEKYVREKPAFKNYPADQKDKLIT